MYGILSIFSHIPLFFFKFLGLFQLYKLIRKPVQWGDTVQNSVGSKKNSPDKHKHGHTEPHGAGAKLKIPI